MTIPPIPVAPLVIGCHHKTGTNLMGKLLRTLGQPVAEKWGLHHLVRGRVEERKLPLSVILKRYPGCHCYTNIWFEHEIDVPAESIRLLHFVRHPVKWVRSAYLFHRRGMSQSERWLSWRVFRLHGEPIGYSDLLKKLDPTLGLAIEAVRSFPEIEGTARTARTSSRLNHRHRITLEQVDESFDGTVAGALGFIGFGGVEIDRLLANLKDHDLSRKSPEALPRNVTRNAPESAELEGILAEDPSFRRLYSGAAEAMGFGFPKALRSGSLLSDEMVEALVAGKSHVLTNCAEAGEANQLMPPGEESRWWTAYALQSFGWGHLMMHGFIQSMIG